MAELKSSSQGDFFSHSLVCFFFFLSHSSGLRPHSCTESCAPVAKFGQDGDIYDIAIRAMTTCDQAIDNSYFLEGHTKLSKEVTIKLNNKTIQE